MGTSNDCRITVIIPTLADASRRDPLLGAIHCILNQTDVNAIPLVVINGTRFDPDLRRSLEKRADLEVLYLSKGHVSDARALGVEHVRTPYFAFLDDDDLFTEDALAHRLSLMGGPDSPDLVVTNFYIDKNGHRSLLTDEMKDYSADPKHSIFELPWLWSSNQLFRTATIGAGYFQNCDRFMEWTALGVILSRTKRISFSNKPTAIYHDTSDSASKQYPYMEAGARLMASVPRNDYSRKTLRLIDKKHSAALNGLSQRAKVDGNFKLAWRFHLECLLVPGGWRYLTYTRKLF